MNQTTPDLDFTDLFYSLNETGTELLPEHFQKAAKLSQSIPLLQQRWQVYLSALSALGFEEWLKQRANDLKIDINSASIWRSAYANLCSAACNIKVGGFQICLLTASNFMNEHSAPFAVFDIPELTAHFYILVQVNEEQNQIEISGFINYQQFCDYQALAQLKINSDWNYNIPEAWFNPDANTLLLNLRCLDANAIQLPIATTTKENDIHLLRQKLNNLKSQLQIRYPSELLTIQEAKILLSDSDLINWVYKFSKPSALQPLINVGNWFNNQIDEITQELGWMLMPLPVFSQFRSSGIFSLQESFEQIRGALEQKGVDIPSTARGAFRDLECEAGSLRLYAITWVLEMSEKPEEWMLLIAVGSKPETEMPRNLQLEVSDEIQQLFSQSLEKINQEILYSQVIGNFGEKFWVTVTADNEFVFEIPPFGLQLEG